MGNEENMTGMGKELHVGSNQPYKTIQAAAGEAQPGDLVIVHAGVYRERVAPPRGGLPGRPIVYRGDPDGGAIIKGSEVWNPDWQPFESGIYYGVPDESLFDDLSPEYVDSHNPFKAELSSTPHGREGKREVERQGKGDCNLVYTCGQVFVNGECYLEAPYPEEMVGKPGTWHYESSNNRIYINFGDLNPKEQLTEITTRRRLFAPKKVGLGYITVENFIMEHCGNQYPTNFWAEPKWAQKGALGTEAGHHWIIRRNTIRFCKTFAIDAGYVGFKQDFRNVKGHLIEYNYIMDNGSAGILSCGSVDQVIRHNVIINNNILGFIGHKRYEDGGIKCHFFQNGLIEGNYIANNQLTFGIWLDNQHPDCRITRNVLLNNGRAGIFLEMSDYDWDRVLVDNNVIMGNRENQIYIHDASGATFVHNLFANTPGGPWKPSENYSSTRTGRGVLIKQVAQRTASGNISFYNNLFLNHDRSMHDINYPEGPSGPKRGDYNVYDAQEGTRVFCINGATFTSLSKSGLVDKVHMDLGTASPDKSAMGDDSEVKLTLKEWTAFWASHRQNFDAHSILNQGSSAAYSPQTHQLTLNITFDPSKVGSQSFASIEEDFLGHRVPQNGQALPGPFQNLSQGTNRFKIWNGLPVPETF